MSRSLGATAVLVAVFLAGAVTGLALDRFAQDGPTAGAPLPSDPALYDALAITAEQRQRIDSILEANQPATTALSESVRVRLRAHLDSLDTSVRAVLTPDQREQLDSLRSAAGEPLAPLFRRRQPAGR